MDPVICCPSAAKLPVRMKTNATTTRALALPARLRMFILPPKSFGLSLSCEFACVIGLAAAHARAVDDESTSNWGEASRLSPFDVSFIEQNQAPLCACRVW